MKTHSFSRFFLCALTASLLLVALPRTASAQAFHLLWAEDLVENIEPALNTYGSDPSYVTWAGVGGAAVYANRSVSATFVTIILKQTYGLTDADFLAWFGSRSPNATRYHDVIAAKDGFHVVDNAFAIRAGDILAIRYSDSTSVSGHVAIARGRAIQREPSAPLVTGTLQFEIPVVDSSSSGHGPTDTRRLPGGEWQPGAGFGVMRLYTDPGGAIVGYSWSTYATSTYYRQSASRHLVIGRLMLD